MMMRIVRAVEYDRAQVFAAFPTAMEELQMCRSATALMIAWFVMTATPTDCLADDYLDLPEGVIHVALPPGPVKMEYTFKNKKPLLRISSGSTVVVAHSIFLGDGKAATQFVALKDGIMWAHTDGSMGFVVDGVIEHDVGTTIGTADFITVDKLKPGGVYVTTPSLKFKFGPVPRSK